MIYGQDEGPSLTPMGEYEVTQNPNGSYVTDTQVAQGAYINTYYSSTGAVTYSSTDIGVNDQTVASSTNQFVEQSSFYSEVNGVSVLTYAGMEYTVNYTAGNVLLGDTWYSAYEGEAGVVNNPNGAQIAWANNIMATGGTDSLSASGVLVRQATALDGSDSSSRISAANQPEWALAA